MRLLLKMPSALIAASQSLSGPPDLRDLKVTALWCNGGGFGELHRSARQVSLSTSRIPLASPCVMHLQNVPQKRESATQFEHDVQRSQWASFPASFDYYVLPFQGKSILVAIVNFCLCALCLTLWHLITEVRDKNPPSENLHMVLWWDWLLLLYFTIITFNQSDRCEFQKACFIVKTVTYYTYKCQLFTLVTTHHDFDINKHDKLHFLVKMNWETDFTQLCDHWLLSNLNFYFFFCKSRPKKMCVMFANFTQHSRQHRHRKKLGPVEVQW